MELSTSTNLVSFGPDGPKHLMPWCIKLCARAGYRVLDLNFCEAMNPASVLRTSQWKKYIDELGETGARLGVRYSQAHLPYYDLFGAGTEERTREEMEKLISRCIEACGMLGISWAVTHSGTVYEAGGDTSVSMRAYREYLAPHVEEALRAGVGLALENDFEYRSAPYQRIYCADIGELCDLADAFHAENVGVCYDFGHANLTGGFHRRNLNRIGSRLKCVHVNDNDGMHDAHRLPYFGTIDWTDAMAGLADIRYDGDLTYEIQEFGRFVPDDMKHLVAELSVTVGQRLIALYEAERSRQGA